MSLFSRAHDIVAAKANKALDQAENPNEMLDYSYQQMLDQITRVRRGLVDIAASRKRIELQEKQLQQTADHLNGQAQAALGQGREDLAREALSRKSAAQQQIADFEAQRQDLSEQEEKLSATLGKLEDRVNSFRSQKEVMKARYTAAQASESVNATAAGISSDWNDTGEALARAQDKIANMEARAGAMDELLASGVLEDVGGNTDDIQEELDKAASASDVDRELAALKAKMATPELPAGGGAAGDEGTGASAPPTG
jgi:phage shock protein A